MSSIAAMLLALLAVVALSANAGGDARIVVTRDATSLPSGCTPRETAELLVRLANAVSDGDGTALDRLFAIEDPPGRALEPAGTVFRWYSVTESLRGKRGRHTVYYDRADLLPYFAARHRQNERWRLIGVTVRRSWVTGAVGVNYVIRRDADDLPAGMSRVASGKGVVDCAARRIFLWSMGQDDHSELRPPCPLPVGWKPGSPIVACADGPNARALATGLVVGRASVELPARCGSDPVRRRVTAALSAFNLGLGDAFAKHFLRNGQFHPYTASISGRGFVGRARIARFVRARYLNGDGWTAAALHPPQGRVGLPSRAVYGLELRVTHQGAQLAEAGAKLVVDCSSGLLQAWIGPGIKTPPGAS